MGVQYRTLTAHIKMKSLLVLTVLVLAVNCEADPEADPALLYLGYPYGLAGHPYTLGYGCRNVAGAPVPCAVGRKRREAEADPAAHLYAGYNLGYYGHFYGYGCHNVAGYPVPCAGKKKRAADPEAEAALLYAGYPYVPYYYGHGCHNYLGHPVPCGKSEEMSTLSFKML